MIPKSYKQDLIIIPKNGNNHKSYKSQKSIKKHESSHDKKLKSTREDNSKVKKKKSSYDS